MQRIFWSLMLSTAAVTLCQHLTTNSAARAQDVTITITKHDEKQEDKSQKAPFTGKRPSVDVAILLDTSNSMDGLIQQAKSQLWNIVKEFSEAKKQGNTPLLRVSVFEYGNTNLPATEGYIRQVVGLTDDLDKVSEALFGLTTRGGDEYCGKVISEALTRLDWSSEPNAYKSIFIAGNEPFTQGDVDYKNACKKAIESGVVVNTIHCGDYQSGISGKWKEGADLAEGEYLNIDQDRQVVHIKCPQDKIIIELNTELNKTYLWYGQKAIREELRSNQAIQDSNAASLGGLASRTATKSSAVYRNVGRDLVDTLAADRDALKKLDTAELPDELQAMSIDERQQHVEKLASQRAKLKQQIAEVSRQRQEFINAERAKMAETAGAESAEATLGEAMATAVRKQLKESGFEIKEEK